MIQEIDAVRGGFELEADAVVVGSGAGGAVAAANLAASGRRVVVLEAGPQVLPEHMTRDAPRFLARYFWEGGLRLIGGSTQVPAMQGRCLGGSTVMNSAIMLKLPDWVRQEWIAAEGLDFLRGPELDRAFERVFEKTSTTATPLAVLGRKNQIVHEALAAVGVPSKALTRAVKDCEGCGDCLTGCAGGRKQSMDRCYLPAAERDGAQIYTCCEVERVLTRHASAIGVTGSVVDPVSWERTARFTVRAPLVVMACGVSNTPAVLLRSDINPGGRVGATLEMHLTGGAVALMEEVVNPWIGATQGWGAISDQIRGMKFEALWASPSLLGVRWRGVGREFIEGVGDMKHACLLVLVYRGRMEGQVGVKRDGTPSMKIRIPAHEIATVQRGTKLVADALFKVGARAVDTTIYGVDRMLRASDTEQILNPRIRARDMGMTGNHLFCSCRMSADPRRGPVDPEGKVRGVDGLYVCDSSLFPSGSAVNPQATIMALSDVLSRRLGELSA